MPLGVFLSGGVDSSSVAAASAELEPARDVRTFSIGFEDPSFDESAHARAVARHLGTDHHERTFSAETVYELLPEVAGWLDEPFGDASILPTHLLSRFARSEVKVVLGGDGADELLAGYPTFAAERAAAVLPPAAAPGPGTGRRGGRPPAGRSRQHQLRLQAQAVPPRRGRAAAAGAPALARLVLGPGDRAAPDRRASLDVEAEHLRRAAALAPGPTR